MDDASQGALKELGAHVIARLGSVVLDHHIGNGELNVETTGDDVVRVMKFLRDDAGCQFKSLMDICGVDFPEREKRFEVNYNLLSYKPISGFV